MRCIASFSNRSSRASSEYVNRHCRPAHVGLCRLPYDLFESLRAEGAQALARRVGVGVVVRLGDEGRIIVDMLCYVML